MTCFDDAKNLIACATSGLDEIRLSYEASVREKIVSAALLVAIKNFLENLRSALDYSARGLFDKYGTPGSATNIYFPYARVSQSRSEFSRRVDKCVPGLAAARPDVVAILEGYQHFADPKNGWLPEFMELNNENKHERLTPQTRSERRELVMESGGAEMRMGEGAEMRIGKGAVIRMGGMVIPGGQSISTSSPPVTVGTGKVEVVRWVSFTFDSNGKLVIPFLETVLEGASTIVDDLSRA